MHPAVSTDQHNQYAKIRSFLGSCQSPILVAVAQPLHIDLVLSKNSSNDKGYRRADFKS